MAWFRTEKRFFNAVQKGDMDTVRDYLEHDAKYATIRDKNTGNTPLHVACAAGNLPVVKALCDKGAGVNDYNLEDYSYPLHAATRNGHAAVVRFLLDKGAATQVNSSVRGSSPLQLAILAEGSGILEMFLATGKANLISDQPPAVYFAVEHGKLEGLKTLLAAGADPNVPRVDEREEHVDVFTFRIRTERIITKVSPLVAAISRNNTEAALLLLAARAKPLQEETPLMIAASNGNIELATEILKAGAGDIRERNAVYQTALHAAARNNRLEMAQFLLAQGISTDIKDKQGRTAVSYAQEFALSEMTALLAGPLPQLTPVKQAAQPEPPQKAPPAAVPKLVSAVAPASLPQDNETWALAGKHSVAHISTFPALNRRITEIFNFESRERAAFTENLSLRSETMAPHESFDSLSEDALERALKEYRRLGGKVDDDKVFKNRVNKLQIKK